MKTKSILTSKRNNVKKINSRKLKGSRVDVKTEKKEMEKKVKEIQKGLYQKIEPVRYFNLAEFILGF